MKRPYNAPRKGGNADLPNGPTVPRRENSPNRRVYNIDVEAVHPEHGFVTASGSGHSVSDAMKQITEDHGIPAANVFRVRGTSPGRK